MTHTIITHTAKEPSRFKRWWMAWNGMTPVVIGIEVECFYIYIYTVWVHRDTGFEYFWRKHMPLCGSLFNGQRVTGFTYRFL